MSMETRPIIPHKGTDRPAQKYLNRHVRPNITAEWYDIGLELLDEEDECMLNTIRLNYPENSDRCTTEMLQLWLARKSNPSWNQLIDALRAPHIKLEALASNIEGMLSKGSIDRKRKTDDNNHDVISGIDKKRKENDTDVTSGNYEVDFKGTIKVPIAFSMLLSIFHKTIGALNDEDFQIIKSVCVNRTNRRDKKLYSSLCCASNSKDFFEALTPYCNWMNLDYLETIAGSYCSIKKNNYLLKLIEDYSCVVFSKKLGEIWDIPIRCSTRDKYYTKLTAIFDDKDPDNVTVKELIQRKPELAEKIAIHIAVIQKKCLLISWLIPTNEVYQTYLSFLIVPQKSRKDILVTFGNWTAYLPRCVLQEEQKKFGLLSSSTLLIGYYHGLLLRDTNAVSLIGYLYFAGLLTAEEQNIILSGHSLHHKNWLLLEYIRRMDSQSVLVFSELVKEMWPQIGSQLVTALSSDNNLNDRRHSRIVEESTTKVNFRVQFSYTDPSTVLTIFFQASASVVDLLQSCHLEVLLDVCKNLMASNKHSISYFCDNQMKRLKYYENTHLLLQRLTIFFTWSNHSILRMLANQCSEAVNILDNFDCRIDPFELIASYPIPCFSLNMIPVDSTTDTILAIRCGQELYESTLQYVYDMQSVMMEKCNITQHCLQILAVRSDPTILYWSIPKCVLGLINTNIPLHSEYLYSRGILEVLVYPDLQFTFGNYDTIGLFVFCDDLKLVEKKLDNTQGYQKNLQETMEHLKTDKVKLREQVNDLTSKLELLESNKSSEKLHEKLTNSKLENAQLNKENENLRFELQEQAQLHNENEVLKLGLTEKFDELNKHNKQLKLELQEIAETMIKFKMQNEELNKQNEELYLDIQKMKNNNFDDTEEYQKNLQETIEHLKTDKIKLKEQLKDLTSKLETKELESNKSSEKLHEKLTNSKLENAKLNKENEDLKLELQELTNKFAHLNKQHTKLNSELQEVAEKTDQLNKHNKQLKLELQEITEKNDKLNKHNKQIKLELQEMTEKKIKLKNQNEELNKQNEELNLDIQKIKNNNETKTLLLKAVNEGRSTIVRYLINDCNMDITQLDQETQLKIKTLLESTDKDVSSGSSSESKDKNAPDETEEKSSLINTHDIMAYEATLRDSSECSNQFKLVTLGAEGAGKTSSINTLLNLPFQANQTSTIVASVNSCTVDVHMASSKWKKITALYRVTEIPKQYRRELKAAISSVPVNTVAPAAPVRPVSQEVINEVKSLIASKEEIPEDSHIRMVIFDIGGQEVYYDVHFLFLAIEDVALLVFDCSKDLDDPVISRHRTGRFGEKIATRKMQSNIETIELLLHSVYSRGQNAPVGSISPRVPVVIMLGAHAEDVSTEIQELIIQTIYQRFYGKPFLKHLPRSKNEAFHFLGNSNPDPKSVDHLRSTILKAAELVITTKRPISYLKFEGKMLEKMQQAQVRLSRADAVSIARDVGVEGEQAVDSLLGYFTNKGILLYYPEVSSLKNEIFISPQEVSDLVCTVITIHECKPDTVKLQQSYNRYNQYALLEEELLVFILEQSKRLKDRKVLLGLLDKFNLVTEIPANTVFSHEVSATRNRESKLFFVPSLLVYDNKVPYHKQDGDIIVRYYFPDGFLPESVFNQLLVKTIQWCCKQKHIVRCIRRGVGYFSFDDARWQQFQLQLCQSTSSVNCYITIQHSNQPPSDMLSVLLQQRRQLLMYLESSVAEVTKCCMPSVKPPVTCLECPLHEEDCTPHVVIDISKRDILVCCENLLATPIPEEFYILLYQETTEACLLTKLLKQKPSMSLLLKIVIPKVATHWDTLAYYLDFEISSVELIKEKCFNNPEKCCKEVFIRWLNSKEGISPKTWEVLLNVLKEITDLTAVTEQIEKELNEI